MTCFVAELARGSTIAGTLTRSRCPGMPVEWSKRQLPGGKVRAIVASSGNSNVFTGGQGTTARREHGRRRRKADWMQASRKSSSRRRGSSGRNRRPTFVADKVPAGVKALRKAAWHVRVAS